MSSARFELKKSTIVLLLISTSAVVVTTGCSTLPRQASFATACPPTRAVVCETFGSERRCACEDRSRIDRQLDRFGHPTALGLNTW
jgi:hypothetical protein